MTESTVPFSCPNCKRPVPNRKSRFCGYCGAAVPEDFLIGEEAQAKLRAQQEAERKRREEQKKENPEPLSPLDRDIPSF
ncbi:MAG: zinc ribbon domain-containing protein [Bdellovibrionales bacterium]|nr:zinc ribbon domain-containing protein [Bdellovibrionales bacterium]